MGKYKIKDLETLTGIKAHTLRIWEKRYGLLTPIRSETKIRTYTDEDLLKLLRISILYNHGNRISKIARFNSEDINRKIKIIYSQSPTCGLNENLLIQSMIELKCSDFGTILNTIVEHDGLEFVYQHCLSSFLNRIHTLWENEKVSGVQLNFVYNLIRRKIIVETELLPIVEKSHFDAVLFTSEGEANELDLLFYNYILRKKGYSTLYLGANLPLKDLTQTLVETHPKSIVVSIVEPQSEDSYKNYLSTLLHEVNLPIYVGGKTAIKFGDLNQERILPINGLL